MSERASLGAAFRPATPSGCFGAALVHEAPEPARAATRLARARALLDEIAAAPAEAA